MKTTSSTESAQGLCRERARDATRTLPAADRVKETHPIVRVGQLWYHPSDGAVIMFEAVDSIEQRCRYRAYKPRLSSRLSRDDRVHEVTAVFVSQWTRSGWQLVSDP